MTERDCSECTEAHYVAIVEVHKDIEIYQRCATDCPDCLARMANKFAALTEVFRARLNALAPTSAVIKKCRVYDTACSNPNYCDGRDACCAGDPDCRALAASLVFGGPR
jgi:hypothetical protein